MKTRIAFSLTLVLMFAGNDSAQSSRGSRRSTTRVSTSRLTDFSNFVGIWEYSGDSLGKSYLKVTEEQPGRFKFMQGFEYQGNITWVATMINGADGIYLTPVKGKLVGRFVSPNFRATHGYDMRYRITLSLEPNGQLLYLLSGDLAPEKYYATKIGGDASPRPAQSIPASTIEANRSWPLFWRTFLGAINTRNRAALKRMMPDDFFNGVGIVTPDEWLKSIGESGRNGSWRDLQKSFAGGTVISKIEGVKTRLTKDNVYYFQFRKDKRWYFAGIVGD